mmetsp:Transcript_11217/g.23778  ORF Transcript_11217/g.23778 Transcript_11217/m.23778 type:complete len:287 (-) Transcript_11217:83-943(-)|eukprot:CAMPEP_0201258882 /NCGR_PEP_ID=MMETSP0853-20130426/3191_1 /ASSEMBLY_ACC=CAM_ASM_000640 /TAXON_ID=183588 /ORGANISM="Pseudo-nitzschia fraudulenta, Strain WWA7" /LENGTH=286 /DNA_ID=CAMNT_0047560687 /DNA_START=114 /DNA_END=974 /DNA_ORIENTATION=-
MAEETVNVNPDGSTTFEGATDGAEGDTAGEGFDEETMEEAVKGIDPAIYLLVAFVIGAIFYFLWVRRSRNNEDDYFSSYDKFNIKLPSEVDEYYSVKEKCMNAGWQPGKPPADKSNANGPHRVMAQALMKRAIGDIPIVTFIQKESAGMNKLYSQSMCSVSQWRAYQNAETLISTEVDEVRAEADEIEPGWSQVIWRQAMQYHNMLKNKHEMEQKAAAETAAKKKVIEQRVNAAKQQLQSKEDEKDAAERIARELLEAEEREKESKKAFANGGVKKGFLQTQKKKK